MHLLLLTLLACGDKTATDSAPPADDGASSDGGAFDGGDSDGGDTDGGDTDGGDTDGGADHVPPGPACTAEDWPYDTAFNQLAAHVQAGTADTAMLEELELLAIDLASGPGPWVDAVVGPWLSTDGATWTEAAETGELSTASVPAATIGPDGDLWIFFVDADLDAMLDRAALGLPSAGLGARGLGGIAAARSSDGLDWERVDLDVTGAVPVIAVDPDIIALPDGRWRLYYYGVPADEMCADTADPFQVPAPHSAWSAVSDDLLSWEHEGPVFTVDYAGTDPAVWCTDDHASCWITMGLQGSSSDGGESFSGTTLDWPVPAPQVPTVFATTEGWTMLYRDPGLGVSLRSTSTDGESWSAGEELSLDTDSPTVVGSAGDWLLFGAEHR